MSDIKPPERFALTPGDKDSQAWRKLKKHFESQLAYWRAQNDNEQADAAKTATMRGRIATYKALLDLDKDSPPGL